MGQIELKLSGAFRSDGCDELPVFVVLHDARVAVTIGHEDVARRTPRDIGGAIECIRSGTCAGTRRWESNSRIGRFGAAPQQHHNLPLRAELDNHIAAFIDSPDVVLWI